MDYLSSLLETFVALPSETEWLEFKHNNENPQQIGEYISALSNSAALNNKQFGYIVWGIKDKTHEIIGTKFQPKQAKVKTQELENWLKTQLAPRIEFKICEFQYQDKNIVLFEIPRATYIPVKFKSVGYIRVGSYTKELGDHPEKERQLWSVLSNDPFETRIALADLDKQNILDSLDYVKYFELVNQKRSDDSEGIVQRFTEEKLINKKTDIFYDVTNLGGILFARKLPLFEKLARKSVRVIIYDGKNRLNTIREFEQQKGYASGFEELIDYINIQLPQNEVINTALRTKARMYPEIAIRELVANAIIHQNFDIRGTSPMIEIFSDRVEITNPGTPLIEPIRFIDQPPCSRNEALASFMRRINICEERGSGIDKVINSVEVFQLPAPLFKVTNNNTQAILFAYKKFANMDKEDRIRACYQHTCLKFVSNEQMTNSSLRKRFSIESKNSSMASRIITDTINAGLIKAQDPHSKSRKYIPFWA